MAHVLVLKSYRGIQKGYKLYNNPSLSRVPYVSDLLEHRKVSKRYVYRFAQLILKFIVSSHPDVRRAHKKPRSSRPWVLIISAGNSSIETLQRRQSLANSFMSDWEVLNLPLLSHPIEQQMICRELAKKFCFKFVIADGVGGSHGLKAFDRKIPLFMLVREEDLEEKSLLPDRLVNADMAIFEANSILDSVRELHADITGVDTVVLPPEFYTRKYAQDIEHLAGQIESKRLARAEETRIIVDAGIINRDYFSGKRSHALTSVEAADAFLGKYKSGGGYRRLFPGFHPGIYAELNDLNSAAENPLIHYIKSNFPEGIWNSSVITSAADFSVTMAVPRAVLHIHVFYPELLELIIARLNENSLRPDLIITVVEGVSSAKCQRTLANYAGSIVNVVACPNRGRNIGALMTGCSFLLESDYDIVGHVHTKKSVPTGKAGLDWFFYCIEHLIGGRFNMADRILCAMNRDSNLGIVFPDDSFIPGWTDNWPLAKRISQKLALGSLPREFHFPVGSMFWARKSCLRPFWKLQYQWDDYPQEPVPINGTLLHAIERLFALTAQNQGLSIATTHVQGISR